MLYSEMRTVCKTGDKLIVRSKGKVGRFIRSVMGSGYSHIAVIRWDRPGDHLDLHNCEMKETKGFLRHFNSDWCNSYWRKGAEITFVKAPAIITDDEGKANAWLKQSDLIDAKYGYVTLPLVWLVTLDKKGLWLPKIAKVLNIDPDRMNAVCSVFAQRFDRAMGYDDFDVALEEPGYPTRYKGGGGAFLLEPDPPKQEHDTI